MMHPSDERLREEAWLEERADDSWSKGDSSSALDEDDMPVWRGDEGDWSRVRKVLITMSRDGPKLDLWAAWMKDTMREHEMLHRRQGTQDSMPLKESLETTREQQLAGSETIIGEENPKREWVTAVLREHVSHIPSITLRR